MRCIVNGVTGSKATHLYELLGSKGRITISNTRPPQFRLFVESENGLKEEPFPEVPEDQRINTFGAGRCVIPLSVEEIVESLDTDADTVSTGRDGRAGARNGAIVSRIRALGQRAGGLPASES